MNILMISYWDFQPHGMQVTLRTPLHFAQNGHKVDFLVHSERTAELCNMTDLHPNLKIVRFRLPFRWTNSRTSRLNRLRQLSLFFVFCLWHVLKHNRGNTAPDVVYAAEADAVLIGSIIKRIYKVPFVSRFYGVGRLLPYFDFQHGALLRPGVVHIASRLAIMQRADMVIVTDDGTRGGELVRALNPKIGVIKYWRNGVDAPNISPDKLLRLRDNHGIGNHDFVVLTVCRLDRSKGVDHAIRAVHFLRQITESSVKLLIVGDGPERPVLESLTVDFDLRHHTVFVGNIPHEQIYKYYKSADVFLSTYEGSNLGNPLWEALNAGQCIVTLDCLDARKVISDRVNGRLVKVGPNKSMLAEDIAGAIAELIEKPYLRNALATEARNYAKEHLWTWNERLHAELDAITDLVDQFKLCR